MPRMPSGTARLGVKMGWIRDISIAILIGILIRLFVLSVAHVDGHSMDPTLHDRQFLVVEKVSLWFGGVPDRGEIVIVKGVQLPSGEEKRIVKRVIGREGDTIEVIDGVLHLNGQKKNEPYVRDLMTEDMKKVTVGKGTVFVMGDNRNNSSDSRMFGPFPLSQIEGVALFTP